VLLHDLRDLNVLLHNLDLWNDNLMDLLLVDGNFSDLLMHFSLHNLLLLHHMSHLCFCSVLFDTTSDMHRRCNLGVSAEWGLVHRGIGSRSNSKRSGNPHLRLTTMNRLADHVL